MDLSEVSTEELLVELAKRRYKDRIEKAKQKASARRCHNCKHFGTASQFGILLPRPTISKYGTYYCPFARCTSDYGRCKQLYYYGPACEHFENINNAQ